MPEAPSAAELPDSAATQVLIQIKCSSSSLQNLVLFLFDRLLGRMEKSGETTKAITIARSNYSMQYDTAKTSF